MNVHSLFVFVEEVYAPYGSPSKQSTSPSSHPRPSAPKSHSAELNSSILSSIPNVHANGKIQKTGFISRCFLERQKTLFRHRELDLILLYCNIFYCGKVGQSIIHGASSALIFVRLYI